MDDNPYTPGTIYDAEPRLRTSWLIKSSVASFVLAIISMIFTQACLTWSIFENAGDFEARMEIAQYPMKAAVTLCVLGFVLLVLGIVTRRRGVEPEE